MNNLCKLALIGSTLLLSACWSNDTIESKHVSAEEVFQNLSISEDSDGKVYARAVYRVGGPTGTTVLLSEPGKIRVNGTRLGYSEILFGGAQYSGDIKADNRGYDFVLTEYSGEQRSWHIPRVRAVPQHDSIVISLSRGGRIPMLVNDMKGDNITVEISQHDTSAQIESRANLVRLQPSELKAFKPGKAEIRFSGGRSGKVTYKDHIGGNWHSSFNSPARRLIFLP